MDDPDRDYHNFSTSSSHRLPTISGTQAVRDAVQNSRPISTSLAYLDAILSSTNGSHSSLGGLQRGVVTELYGPPGAGKTTFALQLVVNAIYAPIDASNVTWIDTSSVLYGLRLQQLMEGYETPVGHRPVSSPPQLLQNGDSLLEERFNYIQIASLHHLLALFMHSHTSFPPAKTSLIVLDDLSNLLLSSLPRTSTMTAHTTSQQTPSTIRNDHSAKQSTSRRFHVISNFGLALQKFAATHNISILVISKATVNLKAGQRATLRSALASQQWDTCLATRVMLYRDTWPEQIPSDDVAELDASLPLERAFRCAQVLRLRGKNVITREVGFVIEEGGLREITSHYSQPDLTVRTIATQQLPDLADALEGEDTDTVQQDEGLIGQDDDLHEVVHVTNLDTTYDSDVGKRKAEEIADSDEEVDQAVQGLSQPLPVPPNPNLPFISHIKSPLSTEDQSISRRNKKYRAEEGTSVRQDSSQASSHHSINSEQNVNRHEEMLLGLHETGAPASDLSQAADTSSASTPSDDVVGSP